LAPTRNQKYGDRRPLGALFRIRTGDLVLTKNAL
jgi:hypothetical protein